MPQVADSNTPSILFLAHRVPYPLDKGERIRVFHALKFLSRRAEIHLACLADEPVSEDSLAQLRAVCRQVAVVQNNGASRWMRAAGSILVGRTATEGAFHSPALIDLLRRWTDEKQFHAVMVSSSGMVPYWSLPKLRELPAVVDLIDVDSQKWFDYAAASRFPNSWLYRTEGRRLRRLEQRLPASTRAVTLVSKAETQLYRSFCHPGTVRTIPCGVDLDYFRPAPDSAIPLCVFVGALNYRPNVDGVRSFCREVWPEIRRRRADARLRLVGRRPTRAVRALGRLPGVEVVGQVADIRPHLAESALAIVPLQIARGVQTKVIEAMAMGKSVVASAPSLIGLDAQAGTDLLVAQNATEWAETVLRVLNKARLRKALGAAARRYVENHHRWEICLGPLAEILGLAVRTGQEPSPESQAA